MLDEELTGPKGCETRGGALRSSPGRPDLAGHVCVVRARPQPEPWPASARAPVATRLRDTTHPTVFRWIN